MKLYAILPAVIALLQREGRVSYRALQHDFDFDNAFLDLIRHELVFKQLALDDGGEGLVWAGEAPQLVHSVASQVVTTVDAISHSSARPALAEQTTEPEASDGLSGSSGLLSTPTAERRQLTVMFCDLVGSTALSGRLDPEELREVVQAYQQTAAEVIDRFEGHIAQYLGDGLLVYFGYPRAHEDDALRAVRTGLGIIEAMQALNARIESSNGVRLALRLGIHTGLVVVGEMGGGSRHEQLALGETPNIAARLEALAAPNTIVISAATARLVQGTFALEDLGTQSLKGVAEPTAVCRVVGPREEQPAEADASPEPPDLLVGRDEEVGFLRRRWEQSKEGAGQVVVISGEAGIGKTSLVDTLRVAVAPEGSTRITLRCSPYYQNSALYPIIAYLQGLLSRHPKTSPDACLDILEQLFQGGSVPVEESVPLMAELVSIPISDGRYPTLDFGPQQHKQHTQDALVAWLVEEAEREPVLLTWEDLQWADPSTLEILGLVIDQAATVRMLNVLTARPEFIPPWPMRSHITPLTLNRLERRQVEALIAHRAGGNALPPAVIQHIVEKTDGVPLFVEELTKMVLESDLLRQVDGHYELTGPLSALSIPSTLQDSLMARLDRLSEVRELAQLGAVLGREFTFEVIRAVTREEDAILQERLTQLVEAELLYQRGRPPRAKYIFKHALIQDAAYTSLLRSTRQHYHHQIAELYEREFSELVEAQPEVVAHHYTQAGLNDQAVTYWQQAGQRAFQRSAHVEATHHLRTGLEGLATLPDTSERTQRELGLQLTLGAAFMATKGYGAQDAGQAYSRARQLAQQLGDIPQQFRALWGLWTFQTYNTVAAAHQTARELGEEYLSLAQRKQDSIRLLQAHEAVGASAYFLAEFGAAREHLEQGIALYDPQKRSSRALQDPGVDCRVYMSMVLWHLGYPDKALQSSVEARSLAQEVAQPLSLTVAHSWAIFLHQLRREWQAAQEQAEITIKLSTDQGFSLWLASGNLMRAWALVHQGDAGEALEQIRLALTAYRTTASANIPYLLAVLAEACRIAGQLEEGRSCIDEGLQIVGKTGERFYEAELYRLKGELALQANALSSAAEACFGKALAVAQQHQARSLELRAAMSLAHLWQRQGKKTEAHKLLAPVYGWFTEGFDTADLKDAKALLEELSQDG